jgi:hypothetical protein
VRSEAWALGHGAVVVKVTGHAGGVLVEHLQVLPPPVGVEQVGWGVMCWGYDESKPSYIGRPRDMWSVDEFFYPFQREAAEKAARDYVSDARPHVVAIYARIPTTAPEAK